MKTKEEVEKKVEEITNEISALFDDPEISDATAKNSAVKIAGVSIYLTCPNEAEFDKMATIIIDAIKQEYLRIKKESLKHN
jgi:hypothetical protein